MYWYFWIVYTVHVISIQAEGWCQLGWWWWIHCTTLRLFTRVPENCWTADWS